MQKRLLMKLHIRNIQMLEMLNSMEMNVLEAIQLTEVWATHLQLEIMTILWNLGERF
ncbi:unnamed protein product [Brassica oleracea]